MRILSLLVLIMLSSCQGSSSKGRQDDPIGGEEAITDSFKCQLVMPSLNKDGEPDEIRGFKLELSVIMFEKGSRAATLKELYTFSDKSTYEETSSRVFNQGDATDKIDTDLLLVKMFTQAKEATVFKKYEIGQSFDMECTK